MEGSGGKGKGGGSTRSVITPAGVIPEDQVHRVQPGETVERIAGGGYCIAAAKSESDSSANRGQEVMAIQRVLTPGGYKPAEKVHHVSSDQMVHMQGNIAQIHHQVRGVVRSVGLIAPRTGARPLLPDNVSLRTPEERALAADMKADVAKAPAFTEVNGWVSYTGWQNSSGQAISKLSTQWKVPPEPANRGAQTVFLFNGIQNATMIYQPVLQWGPSAAGGGQKWSVASWYADGQDGHSFYSTLVDVAVGTVITGVMTLTKRDGKLMDYSSEFTGLPKTLLKISKVEELTWANETLEAYGITSREDFPNTSYTDMKAIVLQTGSAAPGLAWDPQSAYPGSGSHVQVENGSATDGDVRIWYVKA
jgi:hypothetical protein